MANWLNNSLFHNKHRTLFGRPLQQSWAAIGTYEKLLQAHREEVYWICEIGTGFGILSTYFALWCDGRNVPFLTIDNNRLFGRQTLRVLEFLGAEVVAEDCFSEAGHQRIASFITQFPGLLFCDGGYKIKEATTFAPLLPLQSIVVIHDYGREVKPVHMEAIPELEAYEPWHTQSLEMKTKAGIFRRVQPPIEEEESDVRGNDGE